jgi:hypothetical protein
MDNKSVIICGNLTEGEEMRGEEQFSFSQIITPSLYSSIGQWFLSSLGSRMKAYKHDFHSDDYIRAS